MQEEDTTCFVVVDRWGNAVCQLQSIQSSLGSSIVAGETGILLNNRMTYWHLDPDHPDCLQPGKRVRHTMNPIMVFRDAGESEHSFQNGGSRNGGSGHGGLALVCGTPGADTQVQTNMQVITHVLDFGMTVCRGSGGPAVAQHPQPDGVRHAPRVRQPALRGVPLPGGNAGRTAATGAYSGRDARLGSLGQRDDDPG